jgi:2-polyprenyl-3-methyl-5-hydroxy-6-metoxy-1,4-benzoquinol methylase
MKYSSFFDSGSTSDKIYHHGYHRIYPWFLNNFLHLDEISLLEIGVDEQNSIGLWRSFFQNAKITVMDIDSKEVEQAKFVQLDQSSKEQLENYAKDNIEIHDIIVDDGSHVPEHQVITLLSLWKTLKPGGVYIIEDIETSYWGKSKIYGYNFNSKKLNLVDEFSKMTSIINSEFILKKTKSSTSNNLNNLMYDVELLTFAYNCIILVKKSPDFSNFYNREYRFGHMISSRKINFKNVITFVKRAMFKLFNGNF